MNRQAWLDAGDEDGPPDVLWEDGERKFCKIRRKDTHGARHDRIAVLLDPEHATPSSVGRHVHEFALRDHLDGAWALRPLELVQERGQTMLVLEYHKGEPLNRLIAQPMEIGRFLRLGVALLSAVGRLHERGLVHKDIKPTNVFVSSADEIRLTGFGITSRLPRERQTPEPPEIIAGTLPYMAPEQTGRMNRSTDSRSDLYSVGVVLYQMLTGSLPFSASDPMEWIHCHIARKPAPPRERSGDIPPPVSAIVMKLLAKTPEERYYTAAGTEHDLRRCLADWENAGSTDAFPLGEHDRPDRLLISEKLYGRAHEIETLLSSFNEVVATGTPALMLVTGYSGIGKSSVVNELHKVLVPLDGLFASGKFDQYQADIPYASFAQAFQGLIRALLGKSETELGMWREALSEALSPNGSLMLDLVPELKHMLGEQPPVVDLPAQDAQRRFQLVVRRFIGVFARPEHPLALFLDDLQWLDAATLDLLGDLLTAGDVRHLLLIGAYRDSEVSALHPLARRLEALRQGGAIVRTVTLSPLAQDDLQQLIADALHATRDLVCPLAELVQNKTGGNPFFAIQFLNSLADEGLLAFDHRAAQWSWDEQRTRAKGYTDNVVDLIVRRLARLPAATQQTLQWLACLGNVGELATLSIVCERSAQAVEAELWEALRQELILRTESAYRFVHDRVQEAVYSQIPEESRAQLHLQIGRRLLAHTPAERQKEAVFELVNQLNRGAHLVAALKEREQMAELNLLAGKRSKASTAYASALEYFKTGAALLPEDGWERLHELSFSLEVERAECEFLTGEMAAAEARLTVLSLSAANPVDRATVACLRIDLYTALDRNDRAVDVCLTYLRHLGIEWSPHPTEEEARREHERMWSLLGHREIDQLIDLPLMSDPASVATLDVLTKALVPASLTDANLFSLLLWRMVNLSLEHGNTDASCQAYVHIGRIAGPRFGNHKAGIQFARLGYDLVERRSLKRFQARTYLGYAVLSVSWTHLRVARDLIRQAFDAANTVGDLTYAAFSCHHLIANLLAAGDSLVDVQREAERVLEFAQNARFGLEIDVLATQLALIRTLRGLTPTFGCFNGAQFDELQVERRLSGDPRLAFAEGWYWIRKLQARFFAGDYAAAVDASFNAQRLLWTGPSFFKTAEAHFYSVLSHAACCDAAFPVEYRQHLQALIAHHKELLEWAENCPENFQNRAALVGAEIARIEGREVDAEHLYEAAIKSARENGFVHNEALAAELAARFYAARGFDRIARTYAEDSRHCYLQWGADGKVRQLDERYPYLRSEDPCADPTQTVQTPVEHLDLATVLKVSQTVSGETDLGKLTATVMRLALEHAGAERGLLMLPEGDGYRIESEAEVGSDAVTVTLPSSPITAEALPVSAFQYVLRTRESVVLHDASAGNPFSDDEYVRSHRARSVLCMPLLKQARLVGVLYLENNLTSGVFTPARMTLLKLLASDAAISLENARLYRDVQEREARVRRLVDSNIIGIVIWHADGRVLDTNEAFLRIVGYEREDLAAGRLRWIDLSPPESHDHDARQMEEVRRVGAAQPHERELVRKNGTRVPVLTGSVTFDGSADEGVAFVVDLTERKRAERALRESERESRLILETIPERAAILTPAGEVEAVNHELVEYCGQPLEAMRQWGTNGTVHADDLPRIVPHFTQAITSGHRYDFEARVRRFDGAYRWCQVRGLPLRDTRGQIARWYVLLSDIDDRKRAEHALLASERNLQLIIDTIPALAWSARSDGSVEFLNQHFMDFIGLSAEQAVGWGWGGAVHPDDLNGLEAAWRQMETSQDAGECEARLRRQDGQYRWFLFRANPLRDETGHIAKWYGVNTDIEDRKRAEVELRRAYEEYILSEQALDKARSELAHVARVAALSTLTASIAHEVNQPLSGIITNASTCLRMLDADPPNIDGARETAKRTIRDGNRAADVITRLRALFGKKEFTLESMNLNEATREVIALSSSDLQRNRIVLQTELAEDLPSLTGDRIQLQQVILNLLRNASDAMVDVHDRPRVLVIRTEPEGGDGVRVTVRDAGVGLGRENLNKLFDAFYTTKHGGMGIGLSVSRSIVEKHHGRLWAEPNDGPGATFAFSIPRAPVGAPVANE